DLVIVVVPAVVGLRVVASDVPDAQKWHTNAVGVEVNRIVRRTVLNVSRVAQPHPRPTFSLPEQSVRVPLDDLLDSRSESHYAGTSLSLSWPSSASRSPPKS